MNSSTRLERDLTDWLRETAMPHTPDYADEILDQTARTRQRPRWTFLSRWVSLPDIRPTALVGGRRLLVAVSLLVVLALILAAVAVFVGNRRTVPAPFGRAGTGMLAVSEAGDIVLIDADTRISRTIAAHPGTEMDPRWSPDGTRLAFLRRDGVGNVGEVVLVVVDATGRTLAISPKFADIDPDSVSWAPSGKEVAIAAAKYTSQTIHLIDAETGADREIPVDSAGLEVFWRPPDGQQLLYRTTDAFGSLAIVSLADNSVIRVVKGANVGDALRAMGWTPDGRSVLYQDDNETFSGETILVDVQTGVETRLGVSFGHVSNDGTRIAGLDAWNRLCVVPISGGPCDRAIGKGISFEGTRGAGVSWSPDDHWIAVSENPVWLVDATGRVAPRALSAGGPGAWQRLTP